MEDKYKNTLKWKIWSVLEFLDTKINHGIFDEIIDWFPLENKDGSDSLAYVIWENTTRKLCNYIVIELYEKWFPETTENQN